MSNEHADIIEDLKYYRSKTHESGSKYTYFLLAIAASAVAFSIKSTETPLLSPTHFFLALAIGSWLISFNHGCKALQTLRDSYIIGIELTKNEIDLFQLYEEHGGVFKKDTIEEIVDDPTHKYHKPLWENPKLKKEAVNSNEDYETSSDNQFFFLCWGGVFFLVWHVFEMIVRTINPSNLCWIELISELFYS